MTAPHPAHHRPGRAGQRLRPLPAIAVLALVLTAHALLLGALPQGLPAGAGAPQRLPTLQTRQLAIAQALPAPTPRPAPMERALAIPAATATATAALIATSTANANATATAPTPSAAVPTRSTSQTRPDAVATPSPAPAAADLPVPVPVPVPVAVAAAPVADPPGRPAAAVPAAEAAELPIFRTRLPPAARLQYELRRGMLRGTGHLFWQPSAEAYELALEGSALGMVLIGWDSRGGFDAAGIAPLRYLDSRRGRDAQAANFRRDSGRITFSGPATELPLPPGAQDRLSWMLQLPAIVEADPARFAPGVHIPMWVVGARGEMAVWSFAVEAREGISVPAGPVAAALRLRREPRKPYDTLVEVWLDPARHHLPVMIRLSIPQTGDSTEFMLKELQWP